MDKYFREDYNPMFDVEPFLGEPGLFNYEEFEKGLAELSKLQKEKEEKKNSSMEPSPSINKTISEPNVIRKGRGEVSNGLKMDKYFRKDYNPMLDVKPFIGETGWFNYDKFEKQILPEKSIDDDTKDTKKKKKKHKEKSKHKKKKHKSSKSKKKRRKDSDNETSSSDSKEDNKSYKKRRKGDDKNQESIVGESIREWDKPKLASGSIIYESVREWDIPKLASGSLDLDKII